MGVALEGDQSAPPSAVAPPELFEPPELELPLDDPVPLDAPAPLEPDAPTPLELELAAPLEPDPLAPLELTPLPPLEVEPPAPFEPAPPDPLEPVRPAPPELDPPDPLCPELPAPELEPAASLEPSRARIDPNPSPFSEVEQPTDADRKGSDSAGSAVLHRMERRASRAVIAARTRASYVPRLARQNLLEIKPGRAPAPCTALTTGMRH
jgi:hypothetical protein